MAGEAPDGYRRSTAEAVIIAAHEARERAMAAVVDAAERYGLYGDPRFDAALGEGRR